MPGDPNDPLNAANLAGLQTRVQVNNLIQQQIASGGANARQQLQQNFQQAQSKMQELKNKIGGTGGSSDDEMPDFKPNGQKTKNFMQRTELGTNLQTQKASSFFPSYSDIGLSLGYKITDRSVIGIGGSYKMGMGSGWRNIRITHEGVSIRSYVDLKLKGSIWMSGGFELNHNIAFERFDQLRDLNAWRRSGLIGVSKKFQISKKIKGKMQLLWDFLSRQQIPRTRSIIFRVGYNFK